MMRLLVETVGAGLHPNEAIVSISTMNGRRERLIVPKQSITENAIEIGWPIRAKGNYYLVELPRETQSGAWRVWTPKDQVFEVEAERMRA